MSRSLNAREKRLLFLCLATILVVVNVLAFREFTIRKKALTTSLEQLTDQHDSNHVWLDSQAFWDKRKDWLDKHMPYTNSAGRSQGQLLEDLQNTALDAGLRITNTTLLEPSALDHVNEVAVNIRIRGDQETMMRWLLTLQAPHKFQTIKSLEFELDTRAREKTPQAQCNLTIGRWFNTEQVNAEPPPTATPANLPTPTEPVTEPKSESEPQPEPESENEPEPEVNPLDLNVPLETA